MAITELASQKSKKKGKPKLEPVPMSLLKNTGVIYVDKSLELPEDLRTWLSKRGYFVHELDMHASAVGTARLILAPNASYWSKDMWPMFKNKFKEAEKQWNIRSGVSESVEKTPKVVKTVTQKPKALKGHLKKWPLSAPGKLSWINTFPAYLPPEQGAIPHKTN